MPTKSEKAHMAKVAALGCIACRLNGIYDTPATLHHIRHGQGIAQRASNFQVIPLCSIHHQTGDGKASSGFEYGLHHSPKEFEAKFGSEEDLLRLVLKLII